MEVGFMFSIRVVKTTDEFVKGAIIKFEVVNGDEFDRLEPISSHYTLHDAENALTEMIINA
jgi:hypothetical protein